MEFERIATRRHWGTRGITVTSVLLALMSLPVFLVPSAKALPDDRAWELVSPPDKGGGFAGLSAVTDDGETGIMTSRSTFADAQSFTGATPRFQVRRGPDGWITHTFDARDFEYPYRPQSFNTLGFDSGLTRQVQLLSTPEEVSAGRTQGAFYFVAPGGDALKASPTLASGSSQAFDQPAPWRGSTDDLSTIVMISQQHPDAANDTTAAGKNSLYEIVGAGGTAPVLRLVGVDGNGNPLGPQCNRDLGSSPGTRSHAVAQDAATTTITFTAQPLATGTTCASNQQTNPQQVYVRRESRTPPYAFTETNVSASRCTRTVSDTGGVCYTGGPSIGGVLFEGASADGHKIFFSTARQLVNEDIDTGANARDIYVYDFDAAPGRELVPVTVTGTTTPTDLQGLVRISDDGSRVYFVAGSVLATNQGAVPPSGVAQLAQPGAKNLYVYERDADHPSGHTSFVARLDPVSDALDWNTSEGFRPVQAIGDLGSPDNGRFLLFTSAAQLADTDTDAMTDIYLYDSASTAEHPDGDLDRIWISDSRHNGASRRPDSATAVPISTSSFNSQGEWRQSLPRIAPDGAPFVVFTTTEPLVSDASGGTYEVYEWRDGAVSMISDGKNPSTMPRTAPIATTTPSGRDVFFQTASSLVPADTDTNIDVYDARVDGGFGPPVVAPTRCRATEGACQGQGSPTPFLTAPVAPSESGAVAVSTTPTFSVSAVSAADRRAFAKTGTLLLAVRVSHPGGLTAQATAKLHGRAATVARGARTFSNTGLIQVPLRLSRAARAVLADKLRLTVKIAVAYSKSPATRSATLKLTLPKRPMSSMRKTSRKTRRAASSPPAGKAKGARR